jgi:hypothetical protein
LVEHGLFEKPSPICPDCALGVRRDTGSPTGGIPPAAVPSQALPYWKTP